MQVDVGGAEGSVPDPALPVPHRRRGGARRWDRVRYRHLHQEPRECGRARHSEKHSIRCTRELCQ